MLSVIDVAIGLTFVYLTFSIGCSAIVEWIAAAMWRRARLLEAGLRQLLVTDTLFTQFDEHPMITGLKTKRVVLTTTRLGKTRYPDYLPTEVFTLVFMSIAMKFVIADSHSPARALVNPGIPNADKTLAQTFLQGTSTAGPVQTRIDQWFKDAMEVLSGKYKRYSQVYAVGVAIVFTLAFQLDTIDIMQRLYANGPLRDNLVAAATTTVNKGDLGAADAKPLRLPFALIADDSGPKRVTGWQVFQHWAGLVLSAIALSFGAPFWFDILKKLVNLRQSGTPPDERGMRATIIV